VAEIAIAAVTTSRRSELDWLYRGVGRFFPQEWERFRDGVPEADRDGNLAAAYARLLADPATREEAAVAWCAWEDAHVGLDPAYQPSKLFQDPARRMTFARLVTHYWGNGCFLTEDLVEGARALAGVPGVLIHGRLDVSGPLATAWELHRNWPGSELVVARSEGHGGLEMLDRLEEATDRFR